MTVLLVQIVARVIVETSTRPSVAVLQVQVCDCPFLHIEGDPPVAGSADTPGSGPVAGQLMDTPTRRPLNAVHVSRADKARMLRILTFKSGRIPRLSSCSTSRLSPLWRMLRISMLAGNGVAVQTSTESHRSRAKVDAPGLPKEAMPRLLLSNTWEARAPTRPSLHHKSGAWPIFCQRLPWPLVRPFLCVPMKARGADKDPGGPVSPVAAAAHLPDHFPLRVDARTITDCAEHGGRPLCRQLT